MSNEVYVLKELINKVKDKVGSVQIWNSLFHNYVFKGFRRSKKSKPYSLDSKLKFLQSNLNCDINSVEYINCKNQLEEI